MTVEEKDCTILLVRHAHVEMAGRFCGSSDPPLSKLGRGQAEELAEKLVKCPLTSIFSSDLRRARETAQSIASSAGLCVEWLPALREMSFGVWEGLDWDEVSARDAAYAKRWMAEYPWLHAPGGEKFSDFRERVRCVLAEIAMRTAGGCAAVVTHGGVIRTLMLDVLHLPERRLASMTCDYASYCELEVRSGKYFLKNSSGLHLVQINPEDASESD